MSKADKIKKFDPNSLADKSNNVFGLPFSTTEAEVIIIPVPWEVTVSYRGGTANGPQAMLNASFQIDLYDPYITDAWKIGLAMETISAEIKTKNDALRVKAEKYIALLEKGETPAKNKLAKAIQTEINKECVTLNNWVKQKSLAYIKKNKIVALFGGDHSTPLGLMQALGEHYPSYSILQIDAHADLREAYEGFEYSHASIMYNALKIPQVNKLVQVGIRDYCEAEAQMVHNSNGTIVTFYDRDIKHKQYQGKSWGKICKKIIAQLSEHVYLSFDIDGLDPKLCPNTGTPVAGGFEFEQALYLIQLIVESGKRLIAFDINEVAPGSDEGDASVGARLLYRIAALAAKSNGKA